VSRNVNLLGQQVGAVRDFGVMEKFDFFDWLFTVTKLRTVNWGIPVVTLPLLQSVSRQPPADRKA